MIKQKLPDDFKLMWRARIMLAICSFICLILLAASLANASLLFGAVGFAVAGYFKWRAMISNTVLLKNMHNKDELIRQIAETVEGLKSENNTLVNEARQISREVISLQQSIQKMEERELAQIRELEAFDNTIAELNDSLEVERARYSQLKGELQVNENALNKKFVEMQNFRLEKQELLEHLEKRERDIEMLEKQIDKISEELETMRDKLGTSEANRLQFSDILRSKDESIEQLRRWIDMIAENQESTSEVRDKAAYTLSELESRIKTILLTAEEEHSSLSKCISSLTGRAKALETLTAQIQADIGRARHSISRVVAEGPGTSENLKARVEALKKSLESVADVPTCIGPIAESMTIMKNTAGRINNISGKLDLFAVNLNLALVNSNVGDTQLLSHQALASHAASLATASKTMEEELCNIEKNRARLEESIESLNDGKQCIEPLLSCERELDGLWHRLKQTSLILEDCLTLAENTPTATELYITRTTDIEAILKNCLDTSKKLGALVASLKSIEYPEIQMHDSGIDNIVDPYEQDEEAYEQ